jgi:CRP/FNR family transcriptional regulator
MLNTIKTNSIISIDALKNNCNYCHSAQFCLVRNLKESELLDFNTLVKRRKPLQRGERLFQGGDSFFSLYIVYSGSVKTTIESKDGEEQITGFYSSGDLIGVDGFENGQHTYSVEALETSSFCEIPFSLFEDMAKKTPVLQMQLYRYISREISREQKLMLLLGRMNSRRKLATFLVTISLQLQQKGYSACNINLSMTRHDIASYLGLSIETVSRILTQLQNEKVLKVTCRNVIILNQRQLHSIANNCPADEVEVSEIVEKNYP